METRRALKSQYHATLAMLKAAVEICPESMWEAGQQPRTFWRITYHTLFYAHLYLMQCEADFKPWQHHVKGYENVWDGDPSLAAPSKQTVLDYCDFVDQLVDPQVDSLDLDTDDCGFSWYSIPKLEHQINNIRHIQEHTGQLRERLFDAGFDLRWYGKVPD